MELPRPLPSPLPVTSPQPKWAIPVPPQRPRRWGLIAGVTTLLLAACIGGVLVAWRVAARNQLPPLVEQTPAEKYAEASAAYSHPDASVRHWRRNRTLRKPSRPSAAGGTTIRIRPTILMGCGAPCPPRRRRSWDKGSREASTSGKSSPTLPGTRQSPEIMRACSPWSTPMRRWAPTTRCWPITRRSCSGKRSNTARPRNCSLQLIRAPGRPIAMRSRASS